MARELPEGAEWATAPLLDPANVGRYVWYVYNHNTKFASPLRIVKIGRTNVHVDTRGARPSSMRVNPDTGGHTAVGTTSGGYGESCHTEQWRLDTKTRQTLREHLRLDFALRRVPVPTLERIVELVRPDDGLTDRKHHDHAAVMDILDTMAMDAEANAAAGYGRLTPDALHEFAAAICDVFYERTPR